MARLEWLQLLAFSFASPFVLPFLFLASDYPALFLASFLQNSLPVALALTLFYAVLMVVVSVAVNAWRVWRSGVRAEGLPLRISTQLRPLLASMSRIDPGFSVDRLRVNMTDLMMGAHVRGVLRPNIVISGGMLVGLLRKDPKAFAILRHEVAHIGHHDLLLPGLIGLALFDIIGLPLRFLLTHASDMVEGRQLLLSALAIFLYKMVLLGTLVSMMSRRREFYADAVAISASGHKDAYLALLSTAGGHERDRRSFFHPSMRRRGLEVRGNFPTLDYAPFWRLYFVAATLVAWLQWNYAGTRDGDIPIYFSTFCLGLVVLAMEFLRGPILRSRPATPSLTRGRTIVRHAFLLGGFIAALVLGPRISDSELVVPLLGGVVFVIFRATK